MTGLLDFLAQSHHGFWWEAFSLASAGLALGLLVIAIIAYKRHGIRRLFPLSIAFGLFILKVGISHLDSLYPAFISEINVASVATEFGMLSMIFLAMVRK